MDSLGGFAPPPLGIPRSVFHGLDFEPYMKNVALLFGHFRKVVLTAACRRAERVAEVKAVIICNTGRKCGKMSICRLVLGCYFCSAAAGMPLGLAEDYGINLPAGRAPLPLGERDTVRAAFQPAAALTFVFFMCEKPVCPAMRSREAGCFCVMGRDGE